MKFHRSYISICLINSLLDLSILYNFFTLVTLQSPDNIGNTEYNDSVFTKEIFVISILYNVGGSVKTFELWL